MSTHIRTFGYSPVRGTDQPAFGLTGESPRSYSGSLWAAISDLVGLIYEATADPSHWQAFLDGYVQAVGGSRGYLMLSSGSRNGMAPVHWSNWPDEDVRLYVERYKTEDLYRSAGVGQPEGAIRTIDLTCSAEALERSTAHRTFFESRGVRYQLSGVFLRSGDASSTIVAMRGERDGPFMEPAFSILHSLMPHLRQASLLHGKLSSLRAQLAAFTAHLDRYPYAFLLTDSRGHVIYANASANEAAALKDGLVITSGQLSLMSPKDQAAFLRTLERLATDRGPALCRFEVKRPSKKSPYLLLLMPVSCSSVAPIGLAPSAVSVLVVENEARPQVDPAILRELFSLTPAEARVTRKLCAGWSAQEIAEVMGVSLETVRTHIRRIFSKTATGRQGELISLVLRAAPFRSMKEESLVPEVSGGF